MTEERKMQKTSAKLCRSCKYSTIINGTSYVCYYIVITKKRRNCPNGWCDKYEPKTKRRRVRMKKYGRGFDVEE